MNLMALETRLLLLSALYHHQELHPPGDLSQAHFVAHKGAPDLVDVVIQVHKQVDASHMRLHAVGQGDKLDRLMKVERFPCLRKFARFHPIERQDVVEDLLRQQKPDCPACTLTFSIIVRLPISPWTISACSSSRPLNTFSPSRFCTASNAVLSGTRTS